jgi:hypothetical protein
MTNYSEVTEGLEYYASDCDRTKDEASLQDIEGLMEALRSVVIDEVVSVVLSGDKTTEQPLSYDGGEVTFCCNGKIFRLSWD